jgi:hypothetical protein
LLGYTNSIYDYQGAIIIVILTYVPGAIWLLKPCLAFEASMDPVDTSAQAALAQQQTTEQKEYADTTLMAM